LPYLAHVDEKTIMLQDGRLMQVVEIEGLPFETLDTTEINYRKSLREATFQAIGSSRFALYQHIVRRQIVPQSEGDFPDPFSGELDRRWTERLSSKKLYGNQLFLCLVYRPLQGRAGVVARLTGSIQRMSRVQREAALAADREALSAGTEALVSALSQYGARVLTTYGAQGGLFSEPLEFLSALLDSPAGPIAVPAGHIGRYLPRRRVSFGANTVELASAGAVPSLYAGIVSIKEYPAQTGPGFIDDLMRLPFELLITQTFGFVDRQAALGKINLALRRMRSAEDAALSLRSELGEARDAAAAGRLVFGEHHLSVAIYGASEQEVADGVAEVQSALSDLGVVAVREDIGLEPAYWAQFPGNFKYISRRALISSRNFASFASLHNFPSGRPEGNHWGKAVAVLETTSAGAYHFNFHHGDLGNFTVIGPSGSGKTVVLNFLLAQARRFDPRIVFFDKDRGAELFLRALGGRYDILRPGEGSGLNPLSIHDTPENRHFLVGLILQLVGNAEAAATPEEVSRIKEAVDASMDAPLPLRRMRHFADLLRGGGRPHPNDLASRLAPWWGNGEHAWLFDNEHDLVDLNEKVVGFDMTRLLDDPVVRTPAMMYLFMRVEQRLDGTPSIIVIDEGWKALDDEIFTRRIRDWEKTIRKLNGLVGFVTQSAEDALDSKISSAIVEQAATQIFMANPKAQAQPYIEGFGLSEHEFQLVRSIPDGAHAFLIKHGTHSVVARLNLGNERDLLTILSGRESTIRILDDMRHDDGSLPSDWLPRLLKKAA
jgi:type IV secretion system protein VirB4